MWTRAPAPSVTLTASASPLRGLALATSTSGSQVTGGTISAVTTNLPAVNRSLKRLRRAACTRASGPDIGWLFTPCDCAAVKQAPPSVVNAGQRPSFKLTLLPLRGGRETRRATEEWWNESDANAPRPYRRSAY